MITPPRAVTMIERDEMLDEATARLEREIIAKQRAMRAGVVRKSEIRKSEMRKSKMLAMAETTRDIAKGFKLLNERIRKLETKLAEHIDAPHLQDAGVWRQEAGTYPAHSMVSHANSLWCSRTATAARPGTDPTWRMMTKSHEKGHRE
jgi:hypothetical protein